MLWPPSTDAVSNVLIDTILVICEIILTIHRET